jgi:hypothetical protein
MRLERKDFSVVAKSKGKPPNPWRWEIYRAGRSSPIDHSTAFFPTLAAAKKNGRVALEQLLKRLQVGS